MYQMYYLCIDRVRSKTSVDGYSWLGLIDFHRPTLQEQHRLAALLVPYVMRK